MPVAVSGRLSDGFAGGYLFVEGSGTSVGNIVPGSSLGGATVDATYASWTVGERGPALRTSSADSNAPAIIPDSPDPGWWHDSFTERTVLFHGFLEDDANGAQSLFDIGGSVNGLQVSYRIIPDVLTFYAKNSNTGYSFDSGRTFVPGDEIIAVAVFDGTNSLMKLWCNGVLSSASGPTSVPSHSDQPAISSEDGSSAGAATKNFGGLTYAFLAWDRALSDEEALELSLFPYAIFRPPRTWFLLGAGGTPVSADTAVQAEWTGAVQSDSQLAVEALAAVDRDIALPGEILVGVSSGDSLPVELLAALQADAALQVETLSGVSADAALPVEWTGAVLVSADAPLPVEWTGHVSADTPLEVEHLAFVSGELPLPLDWTGGVVSDQKLAVEWLQRVLADAGLPTDWVQAVGADVPLPVEWQGAVTVSVDIPLPVEWSGATPAAPDGGRWVVSARATVWVVDSRGTLWAVPARAVIWALPKRH